MQQKEKSSVESEEDKRFSINSDTDFSNRCRDVFDCLSTLESKHKTYTETRSSDEIEGIQLDNDVHANESKNVTVTSATRRQLQLASSDCKKSPDSSSSFTSFSSSTHGHSGDQSKCDNRKRKFGVRQVSSSHISSKHEGESRDSSSSNTFRKPFQPNYHGRGHKNRVPDHRIHPENWTRYTLEDVSNDDLSESANTWAAFSFLEERKKLREAEEQGNVEEVKINVESSACSRGAITFKKPSKKKNKNNTEEKEKTLTFSSLKSSEGDIEEAKDDNDDDTAISEQNTDSNTKFKITKKKRGERQIRSRTIEEESDDYY